MPSETVEDLSAPMPAPPVRQFSFTDFQINNPTAPPPGDRLDAEFDRANNAIEDTITWASVSLNSDGSIRDGAIGNNQLVSGLFDDVAQDIIDEVQPLVDQAASYAAAASASKAAAAGSATAAAVSNTSASGAASSAAASASTATARASAANTSMLAAQTAAAQAQNADNHATGEAALAQDYADVTQAWAEHMPDTIPPNILAVMNITGDHWSSRWWANQAAIITTGALNYRGAWNPVTNTPVLASGGLTGGVASKKGDYYLVSVTGVSVPIDGQTTWTAGDWVISSGSAWQRAQSPAGPWLSLSGGTMSGPLNYIATGSTTARSAQDRAAEVVNVKDFGALGDGVTDDTASINAAIAAVTQLYASYYNPVMSGAVVFPPGYYKTTGIDLPAGVSLSGAGINQTTIFISNGANRSVIRVLEDPVTNSVQWAPRMQGRISGVTINGNPSVQSGTSHGIELADTSYTLATRYGSGVDIYDVRIVGTLNCGLYVGKNRNNGMILNLRVSYAGTYGVEFFACYDWAAQNLAIGVSGLDGLHIYQSVGLAFDGLIIWMSSGSGVTLQQCSGYLFFSNMQIDTNQQYGFWCDPSTGSFLANSHLAISNAQFRNNGLKTDNTFPSIYLHNIVAVTLSNIWFNWDGNQPNKCRYLIETDTSGYVNTVNLTYGTTPGTVAGSAPYGTAPFNLPGQIVGTSNGHSAFQGSLNVTASQQFGGLTISNASGMIATLAGASPTNDNGTLQLAAAGTTTLQLNAAGQSFMAQLYLGNAVSSATPTSGSVLAAGGLGTDIAGAPLNINGGAGTGAAAGGSVNLRTSPVGTTGTTQNASVTRLVIDSTGLCTFTNNAAVRISGNVGFYNTAPIAKPTASGSWAGNPAGKSLCVALAALGLLTDSTTA